MEERENKKLGTILNYAIIVCIAAILIMIICGIVGKFLDKKTNRIGEFSERHPRLNMVIALALILEMYVLDMAYRRIHRKETYSMLIEEKEKCFQQVVMIMEFV